MSIGRIAVPVAATNVMQPMAMGVVTRLVAEFGPASVAAVFGTNPQLTQELVRYLWIMPIGYALYGVLNVSEETLNAIGRPLVAAGQTIIHMFALYAPLALAGAYYGQMQGLLWGVAMANVFGGVIAYWLSHSICQRGERAGST